LYLHKIVLGSIRSLALIWIYYFLGIGNKLNYEK